MRSYIPALKPFPTLSSLSILLLTQHPREPDTHLGLVGYPPALHVPPYLGIYVHLAFRARDTLQVKLQRDLGDDSSATCSCPARTHPRALAELLETLVIVVIELRVLRRTEPRRQEGAGLVDDPPRTSKPGRRHKDE